MNLKSEEIEKSTAPVKKQKKENFSGITRISAHIEGITPLIMHCDTTCDPLNPMTKRLKELTVKKKKIDKDYQDISKLQFDSSVYYDEEIGIYVPSRCLKACLRAAAKEDREGKETKSILFDESIGYPLIPYQTLTPEDLWERRAENNRRLHEYSVSVVIGKSRVISTRAIFQKWSLKFNFMIAVGSKLTPSRVEKILELAGHRIGILERRPQLADENFGKFRVVDFQEV